MLLTTLRTLVIDDSRFARRLIRSVLRSMGVREVIEAETVREALALLKGRDVDLMILDWVMPQGGGAAVLAARQRFARVKPMPPALVLTGHATKRIVEEASALGAAQVVAKPFSATVLRRHVVAALQSGPLLILPERPRPPVPPTPAVGSRASLPRPRSAEEPPAPSPALDDFILI